MGRNVRRPSSPHLPLGESCGPVHGAQDSCCCAGPAQPLVPNSRCPSRATAAASPRRHRTTQSRGDPSSALAHPGGASGSPNSAPSLASGTATLAAPMEASPAQTTQPRQARRKSPDTTPILFSFPPQRAGTLLAMHKTHALGACQQRSMPCFVGQMLAKPTHSPLSRGRLPSCPAAVCAGDAGSKDPDR